MIPLKIIRLMLCPLLLINSAISFQPFFTVQSSSSTDKSTINTLLHASKSDNHDPIPDRNLLDNSSPDSERRPMRIQFEKRDKKKERKNVENPIQSRFDEWGVETIDDPSRRPICPGSMDSVAQCAFHAISSTLYCKHYLDPNIVANARAVSAADRRPVFGFAFPQGRDVGRMGIEIDGARHMVFDMHESGSSKAQSNNERTSRDLTSYNLSKNIRGRTISSQQDEHHITALESRALRRFSIVLASKLSKSPWDVIEDGSLNNGESPKRPIALFFNTIRQALQAGNELQLLQKVATFHGQEGLYDNIRILCLGQDEIPKDMMRPPNTNVNGKERRKWGASKELIEGNVDPTRGLVLVVQPTDWNNEVNPPSPSVGTVQQLQSLLAKASIARIPAVVISPRLTEQFDERGIEQSGYQQSSTYGGVEPPKGPTPWILRDFIPPVFSWVGNSVELSSRPPTLGTLNNENMADEENYDISYLSRVAMTQSVMEEGHPWHIYVVENVHKVRSKRGESKMPGGETNYHYIASTMPRAGRPSRNIILDILSRWA